MGGSYNSRPRTILKGKSNYPTWVPSCKMELRSEECLKALTEEEKRNPATLSADEITRQVTDWLSAREEVPDNGFSTQKINANRAKWRAEAKAEYDAYSNLNDKALGIIYNLCDKHVQTIIASETKAKGAWDRLADVYKQ